ncbi:hypothetical protein EDD70_2770 [Hydrogenoanaerobacterium saccharovorans]|uniref:Uncharacterized protein n=1 Tax=Hydrogenoanaerobacterium saccharovorans TaxID=474960 RepID=A0A1H8ECM8_9FIRM|nr:hypothetical protein EDD70_2770 [Hydrogenoanaerobacterium saccharovorans]SEN17223.1 hypothetical protein SAMN05216180_2977 [Hydrogenoanaerobacterium saccharovorans]
MFLIEGIKLGIVILLFVAFTALFFRVITWLFLFISKNLNQSKIRHLYAYKWRVLVI